LSGSSGPAPLRVPRLTRRLRDLESKSQWSPQKASTTTSCKSSSPTSLLQTLPLFLKFAGPSWLAHFPGCTARSDFITIKLRGIREYATRLSLETPPLVIYVSPKGSDALFRCQGTPRLGRARPEHRLALLLTVKVFSNLTLHTPRYTRDSKYSGEAKDTARPALSSGLCLCFASCRLSRILHLYGWQRIAAALAIHNVKAASSYSSDRGPAHRGTN
jgi:hypothetical protein